MCDVFVQVWFVLTAGGRTGGARVELGWVWSRSVLVEPQDPSGAVHLRLHYDVSWNVGSWIRVGHVICIRVYCRPIDGNVRFK